MVHRIQNRNSGYSDFSNLGSNTSFNFSNSGPISNGANALKLDSEVMSENTLETDAINNENINQINNQYHEELLKNQDAESIVEKTVKDEENSFTKDAIEDLTEAQKSYNDLKEFGVDNESPDLFSSESENSNSEELLLSENEDQEDELEIPAFLRRQKN